MPEITTEQDAVIVRVKVVPGASRTRYMGDLDGEAKIAVAAAPEKGKANKALLAFLTNLLGVPLRNAEIIAGHTSAHKKVRINHMTVGAVLDALANA